MNASIINVDQLFYLRIMNRNRIYHDNQNTHKAQLFTIQ